MTYLDDAIVFQNRFERLEGLTLCDLAAAKFRREKSGNLAFACFPMTKREIGRFIGRDGHCQATQRGLHRVEAAGFALERQHAGVVSARDPMFKAIKRADRFIPGGIDLAGAQGFEPPFG